MPLHRTSGRRSLGVALAFLTTLQWGVLPLVLQRLLIVLDARTIVWTRFLVAAAVLLTVLAARRRLPSPADLAAAALLIAVATLGLAVNYLTFMIGLDWTTAGTAQVVIQLAPFLLALGGWLVFRERMSRGQAVGFGLLVSGLALWFTGRSEAAPVGARFFPGVLVLLAAAAAWAAYSLAQKQLLVRLASPSILAAVFVGCALLFAPLASPAEILALSRIDLVLLATAGVATVLAYGCFAESLQHLEASRVGAVIALTPLFTLAFSRLGAVLLPEHVAAEPLFPGAVLGALVVVAGSAAGALGGQRGRIDTVPGES